MLNEIAKVYNHPIVEWAILAIGFALIAISLGV